MIYRHPQCCRSRRRSQALLVRRDSGIKSVTDLKDRKLGSYGTTINANLFVLPAAEKAGIDAGEIKFVPLNTDQITAALLTGSVGAVQTWDPFAPGEGTQGVRRPDQERRLERGDRPHDRRGGPRSGWMMLAAASAVPGARFTWRCVPAPSPAATSASAG
ncbi:ABC transporter substrate-binding protein [Streptomyces sp. NPDC059679]|uniref:ABC transporter substrate-binding protein n=1 Tax=Streptomyces sp. NPDC059679 TaxID=3346903 RepID=UPI003683BCA1